MNTAWNLFTWRFRKQKKLYSKVIFVDPCVSILGKAFLRHVLYSVSQKNNTSFLPDFGAIYVFL